MALTAGIRKWFPTANINMFSGQLGFDIDKIVNSLSYRAYLYLTPDAGYTYIGIQNVSTHNIEIQAKKAADMKGDDLCLDADFVLVDPGIMTSAGSNWFTMLPEDIVYGRFSVVALKKPTGTGAVDTIKLIRGVDNG